MKDLWIGDWVKILSSGKTGKYEGLTGGKAKVKVADKHIVTSLDNLELIPEELIPIEKNETPVKNKLPEKPKKHWFQNTLDLHIEKLNPAMTKEIPEMILAFQLKNAKNLIEEAIKRKQHSIILIHGKGLGSLKMEIEHLLKNYKELNYFIPSNDGGATNVFFKYY